MENTSGHGKYANVPTSIDKWNWGAFWLTWIWGIAHQSYIALLVFFPILNLIMPFYLGKNGNKLAWKNNHWYNEERLIKSQRKWAIAGWIFAITLLLAGIFRAVNTYNFRQEKLKIRQEAFNMINEDASAMDFIGEDYYVKLDGGIASVVMGSRKRYSHYTLIIETEEDIYWMFINFDEYNDIESVELSRFSDEKKYRVE